MADDTPEMERFALLFERGRPVQRLSVMLNLPLLLRDHGGAACTPLLKMLADETPTIVRASASVDDGGLAIAIAQGLGELLQAEQQLPLSALEGQVRAPLPLRTVRRAPARLAG